MSRLLPWKLRIAPRAAWALVFAGASILGVITVGVGIMLAGLRGGTNEQSPILVDAGPGTEDLSGYCHRLVSGDNRYVGTSQRESVLQELETPAFESPGWLAQVHVALAHDYLRFGETTQAARLLEKGLNSAGEVGFLDTHRAQLLDALAVTYLKMGELDNCLNPTGALT